MRKSALLIIFAVVFIDLLGFGIVIPILPYYAKSFGASAWELGWLMTVYSLMQFLIAPLWGRLSDQIGRRPVLLVSIFGTAASMTLLGFSTSLPWLFIGRAAAGLFGANISTAYAYIADVTDEKNRARGMGIIGAGFGLGFIFGPALGGILSRYGYAFPMFAGAGLATLNWLFAWWKLEEPRLTAQARAANRVRRFDLGNIRRTLADPLARRVILLFFLLTFAVTQMESVFALYLNATHGYDAQQAGMLLALMGIIMVILQGGLIGRLARRYGEPRLILLGNAVCALALFAFAAVLDIRLMIAALSFLAVGHGMLHPSLSSLVSQRAAPEQRGLTMGVFQSAGSLARILGPPCAGLLFDRVSLASPFFAGAVVLCGAVAVTGPLFKRKP